MQKIIRTVAISLGTLIAVGIIASLGYLLKFQAETRKMAPLPTQRLADGIYAVNNSFVDFYLIRKNHGYIAIDAGTDKKQTARELRKIHVAPERVTAVFLTHTDSDHVAALSLFKKAKVFLSRDEEQMINGKTHRSLIFNNALDCAYQLVDDRQELAISGMKIHCILTPGHTPGSMCYQVNDEYLFTGDTLSLRNGKVELFNRFFNMDSNAQKRSIQKLKLVSRARYIYTAHYGYTGNPQKVFARW